MFHDSVDALFSCKEMPFGFNVLDFQGSFANRDYLMLEKLLRHLPMSYLFIQVSDTEYIPNVLMKVDQGLRER